MNEYNKRVEQRKKHIHGAKEKADCGVLSLAVATNRCYATAHKALRKQGRRNRTGTSHSKLRAAIYAMGFNYESIPIPNGGRRLNALPLYLDADERYIAWVANHFAAIAKGAVQDWTFGRQHRVKEVLRVWRRRPEK